MVNGGLTGDQFVKTMEQMLQPQIGADSFVEGVLVEDHCAFVPSPIITLSDGV